MSGTAASARLPGGPAPDSPPPASRLLGRPVNVISPETHLRQRIVNVWRYRELLGEMTRKELKVQYKDSALGFAWSMLNPATNLLVYFVVFQLILRNGIPRFAIFLMSGVLVWNFFSMAVAGACGSIVANSPIIKKVAFPREVPVLAQVGSALTQFGFQSIVLVVFLIAFLRGPAVEYLPLLVPAMAALILLGTAAGILLASINVKMRDMQHLLAVALQVWFWATPIVYPYRQISNRFSGGQSGLEWLFVLYRLNPVTPIVLTFQRAIYSVTSPVGINKAPEVLPDHAGPWWYLWQDLAVMGFALALLTVAIRVFGRQEGTFAELL